MSSQLSNKLPLPITVHDCSSPQPQIAKKASRVNTKKPSKIIYMGRLNDKIPVAGLLLCNTYIPKEQAQTYLFLHGLFHTKTHFHSPLPSFCFCIPSSTSTISGSAWLCLLTLFPDVSVPQWALKTMRYSTWRELEGFDRNGCVQGSRQRRGRGKLIQVTTVLDSRTQNNMR